MSRQWRNGTTLRIQFINDSSEPICYIPDAIIISTLIIRGGSLAQIILLLLTLPTVTQLALLDNPGLNASYNLAFLCFNLPKAITHLAIITHTHAAVRHSCMRRGFPWDDAVVCTALRTALPNLCHLYIDGVTTPIDDQKCPNASRSMPIRLWHCLANLAEFTQLRTLSIVNELGLFSTKGFSCSLYLNNCLNYRPDIHAKNVQHGVFSEFDYVGNLTLIKNVSDYTPWGVCVAPAEISIDILSSAMAILPKLLKVPVMVKLLLQKHPRIANLYLYDPKFPYDLHILWYALREGMPLDTIKHLTYAGANVDSPFVCDGTLSIYNCLANAMRFVHYGTPTERHYMASALAILEQGPNLGISLYPDFIDDTLIDC